MPERLPAAFTAKGILVRNRRRKWSRIFYRLLKSGGLKSNASGADPVEALSMEAIKGLIALLLAAAIVFAAVVFYNSKTEPAYEAGIIQANMANTIKNTKQAALEKTSNVVAHHKKENTKL